MSYGSIDMSFPGVAGRPIQRIAGIRAVRGNNMFDLSITGVVTMAIDDPRTRSDAEKCAGRIASGLGWARLYLSNEGYAVETIYE
jgi:hypothetical protein